MYATAFVLARGLAIHFFIEWLDGKRGGLEIRAGG